LYDSSVTGAAHERDAIGFRVFASGSTGAIHVMAHRLLDADRPIQGRKLLGQWLETHSGAGSEWVHLHFHMAIFELAIGDWDAAYSRYLNNILPAVISDDALTDAPGLAWRLALAAPESVELEWETLRQVALAHMQTPSDPFTELHHLLALAGARDTQNLDRWMRSPRSRMGHMPLIRGITEAFEAFANGRYQHAAKRLSGLAPRFSELGGSRAQIQLFGQISRISRSRADGRLARVDLAYAA